MFLLAANPHLLNFLFCYGPMVMEPMVMEPMVMVQWLWSNGYGPMVMEPMVMVQWLWSNGYGPLVPT